jgi:hypothetical protein
MSNIGTPSIHIIASKKDDRSTVQYTISLIGVGGGGGGCSFVLTGLGLDFLPFLRNTWRGGGGGGGSSHALQTQY